jgi:phospholipase A2
MDPDPAQNSFKEDIQEAREEIGTIIGTVWPELGERIRGKEYEAVKNNPHKNTDAYVRIGSDISQGEKEFLKRRLPIAKAALEKLLRIEIDTNHVPKIAVSCSGGGYRAALFTLGFLLGARKAGFIDAFTYMIGLSGSTGTIATWVSTGLMLKAFKKYMLDCVEKSFTNPTDEEEMLIFETAAIKTHFNQPKTPVDLYGDLLANRFLEFFKDERQKVYLSEQANIIKDGSFPYPIYTAVDGNEHIAENQIWHEYTPHEIGNPIDGAYIAPWAYGRKFKNGKSVKGNFDVYPPEKTLGYHLGTFWSAFGANNKLIKEEMIKIVGSGKLAEFIEHLAPSLDAERPLDFYAEIPNYLYKMKDLKNPESAKGKISKRVDAGTDYNLPISPVNRPGYRQADVIFICDASADQIGDELRKTEIAMRRENLPFPKINYDGIDKKTISIFKENDPCIPIIIYMPRISDPQLLQNNLENPQFKKYKSLKNFNLDYETNQRFASTIHFQYKRKNAEKVSDQIEFNVCANQGKIIQALHDAVERKKQQK